RACRALGDAATAALHFDRIVELHERHPSVELAQIHAGAVLALGRRDEARALAEATVDEHPEAWSCWLIIARLADDDGDTARARYAIDRALLLRGPGSPGRPFLLRSRAQIHGATEPRIVTESIVDAFLEDSDAGQTRMAFQIAHEACTVTTLEAVLAERSVSGADREALVRLFRSVAGGSDVADVEKVLAGHLRQLVERCRRHGAEPIFASYPRAGGAAYSEAMSRVADQCGVELLPVWQRFAELAKTAPDTEYFIRDGHCNSAGYDVIAAAFAECIIRREAARKK
ncbi:MAG: hypothetical protein KDC98_05410, partial [Planctomycetes bacterium]|nr:hypothetical protein [Planctomycetota bacterium]